MVDKRYFSALSLYAAGFLTTLFISGCFLIWFLSNFSNIYVSLSTNTANSKYLLILPNNNTNDSQSYLFNKLPLDDESTLIDLEHFEFLMNHDICNKTNPFLVMLIHSAPANFKKRRIIRDTWGQQLSSTVTLFLVGFSEEYNEQLKEENLKHQDLIQGSFLDSYRNITYKHVMALKWITYHCPYVNYILKLDDDVFVHVRALMGFLRNEILMNNKGLILCDTMTSSSVKRSWRSKWRVSPRDYADYKYPRYCAGWAILYSSDAVFLLYKEAQKQPYFWVDDVHITGTIAKNINLTRTSLHSMILSEDMIKVLLQKPKIKRRFFLGPPNLVESEIRALHNALTINNNNLNLYNN